MTPVRALRYDGRTSHARPVVLELEAHTDPTLLVRADGISHRIATAQIGIGERVGNTHRYLALPDGGSLEILDNEAFDELLRASGLRTAEEPIRALEGRWRTAIVAGLVAALLSIVFLRYGLPALAVRAVRFIPPAVDRFIAQDTLRLLDKTTLSASDLTPKRQDHIRALFAEVTRDAGPDAGHYKLEFRTGGALRANALALPSGVVILTDELVALSKDDDELRGVFAHEVGHLVNRHAMRMLVQSSASTLLLIGIFGDVSAASSLTAVAPTVLVSSAYSRDFERQADKFAFDWMSAHGVAPRHLGELLRRIGTSQAGGGGGYLASHPDLEERVRAAEHR